MVKVMTVFGTRPEAIKMAPLIKELEKWEAIDSIVCVTAQHREMLDQVMNIFDIKPHFDLNIMQKNQTLATITTKAVNGLYDVINATKPDIVLVHGDTSTTFAGSLAAFYNQVKVGHVEAGLRTYDKYSPFPEEMNRKLTGTICDLHFAPTKANKDNLLKESISEESIFVTGNTVIDAINTTVSNNYEFTDEIIKNIDFKNKKVILLTAHRRENLGKPLEDICSAVRYIVEKYHDVEVVYPLHLNPLVRETANRILGNLDRVHLIEPINVDELHNLMSRSFMVMTDSGGLQEEAPSLGKPVLVLRNETERPEAVESGTVKIAGINEMKIIEMAAELIENPEEYTKMAKAVNPYGDGHASERIVKAILYYFGEIKERIPDFL